MGLAGGGGAHSSLHPSFRKKGGAPAPLHPPWVRAWLGLRMSSKSGSKELRFESKLLNSGLSYKYYWLRMSGNGVKTYISKIDMNFPHILDQIRLGNYGSSQPRDIHPDLFYNLKKIVIGL